ncbi:hypothetical protein BKA80DRAFT_271205 [Phyllosticta citrichinensis]
MNRPGRVMSGFGLWHGGQRISFLSFFVLPFFHPSVSVNVCLLCHRSFLQPASQSAVGGFALERGVTMGALGSFLFLLLLLLLGVLWRQNGAWCVFPLDFGACCVSFFFLFSGSASMMMDNLLYLVLQLYKYQHCSSTARNPNPRFT